MTNNYQLEVKCQNARYNKNYILNSLIHILDKNVD